MRNKPYKDLDEFPWDSVKGNIFKLVEEENPDFFKKEKKRRTGFWIWVGGICLTILTVVIISLRNENKSVDYASSKESIQFDSDEKTTLSKPLSSSKKIVSSNQQIAKPSSSKANISHSFSSEPTNLQNQNSVELTSSYISSNKTNTIDLAPLQAQFSSSEAHNNVRSLSLNEIIQSSIFKEERIPYLTTNLLPQLSTLEVTQLIDSINKISVDRDSIYANNKIEKQLLQWHFNSGGIISSSKLNSNLSNINFINDNTTPWFGWKSDLSISAPFANNYNFITRASFSVIYQNIDISHELTNEILLEDVLLLQVENRISNLTTNTYGDTISQASTNVRLLNTNKLNIASLDFGISRSFNISRRTRVTPSVLGSIGCVTNQNGFTLDEDYIIRSFVHDGSQFYNKFLFSFYTGLMIEYKLSENYSLSNSYNVWKQISNGSTIEGVQWRPTIHSFSLGISYQF